MGAPSWTTNQQNQAPASAGPSFMGSVRAGNQAAAPQKTPEEVNNGGFVQNTVLPLADRFRAMKESLARGATGGLSDTALDQLAKVFTRSGFDEASRAKRQAEYPTQDALYSTAGHGIVAPVTTAKDLLKKATGADLGDTTPIFPPNKYFNPSVGGTISTLGDVMSPAAFDTAASKAYPFLQKVSGLTPTAAETFATNPDIVKKFAEVLKTKQGASEMQDMARGVLSDSSSKIGNIGKANAALQRTVAEGHSVPIDPAALVTLSGNSPTAKSILNQLDPAYRYTNGLPQLTPGAPASVPVGSALDIAGESGQSFSRVDPLTRMAYMPNEAETAAWAHVRDAAGSHEGQLSPAAKKALADAGFGDAKNVGDALNKVRTSTSEGIDLQKYLGSAADGRTPIAALNTGSLDKAGTIQKAAKKYGLDNLQNTTNQIDAARELNGGDVVQSGSPVGSAVAMAGHMSPVAVAVGAGKNIWNYLPGAQSTARSYLPSAYQAAQRGVPENPLSLWNAVQLGRDMEKDQ